MSQAVTVFRLGHRPSRDKRVSTHLLLAARAFGAEKAYYTGTQDDSLEESIRKITQDWGGDFKLEYASGWKQVIGGWEGKVVHLTMYGIPFQDAVKEIRSDPSPKLVVVGGAKVPGEVYGASHWNVAVTGQPHSEVSALALFLHELYEGKELCLDFPGARLNVVPQAKGKRLQTHAKRV
ncbi:TPA: tRNA (cytidine(56)-2'-O)-methyltransferase [Candidatus Bathyarchaeota archaeon]|nr:tRNA (cytidine(56)-2'-O)-methyltransferase [Candidatus Bathyarchaeota archaeon]